MSERTKALADAANADCYRCANGEAAERLNRHRTTPVFEHETGSTCSMSGTRWLIENEHRGFGTKPTKEWRSL